jgi:hypothetical protein
MRLSFARWVVAGYTFLIEIAFGQISSFPYVERFDAIPDSTLPSGWLTTTSRRASGDFFAVSSSPRSSPHCAYSQNSTISQSLLSPAFDFTGRTPDKLQFYVSRSGTHTSGLLVEASVDNGITFSIAIGDTLKYPGTTGYILTTLQLPGSLAGTNGVRFRWRVIGGSGGATATIRIDDVSLTTLVSYDLAASRLSVQPTLATSKDSLVLSALVKNLGNQTTTNYSVDFFCDVNNNSVLETAERFASVGGVPISGSDSLTITAGHSHLRAGDYRFFTVVSFPQDERAANDTASTVVTVGYAKGSLLVNEIMYGPSGDEPEWIELINISPDTANLKNWRISDNNVSTKTLVTTGDLLVAPSGYGILAKDGNFISSHPSVTCPVAICNFSALNNTTPDAVVIYEPRVIAIDSVMYSPGWGGQGGKSLERIDVGGLSIDQRNWGTSLDSAGCTPGKVNSIIRLAYDLALDPPTETRTVTLSGLVPVIHCVVHNAGKITAASFLVRLYNDANHNDVGETQELIATLSASSPLVPLDSAQMTYTWESAPPGESEVVGVIDFPQDQRIGNNQSSTSVCLKYAARSVVINEILYDPLANQNEWFELYNRGSATVDLKNWVFRDRPTSSGSINSFLISPQSIFVASKEFAIIAADSSILTLYPSLANPDAGIHLIILNKSGGLGLGNDGDDIVLQDLTGATIDSVSYSPFWHRPDVTDTKGRSLEKINPDFDANSPQSWTTSVVASGGTPGKPNIAYTAVRSTTNTLSFAPNPFSPDGDGFEDFCVIQYNLTFQAALVHARVYDIKGRLVRTLANSQISAAQGNLVWDGLTDEKQRVRIGVYIVLIEATDSNGGSSTSFKGVVVVARKL